MKKTTIALLIALFGFVGTAGAANAPAAPTAPGKPASGAATVKLPPRAKIDWDKMTTSQRKKYMKATVLPQMKKLFVAFDKRYKTMSCKTCHGEKAVEDKFKMPNAELPKLPAPTDRQGFMALHAKKPEFTKFMGTEVKPAMAALLNVDEWTPANPKGFGCYGCHTAEAAPAPARPAGGGGW